MESAAGETQHIHIGEILCKLNQTYCIPEFHIHCLLSQSLLYIWIPYRVEGRQDCFLQTTIGSAVQFSCIMQKCSLHNSLQFTELAVE